MLRNRHFQVKLAKDSELPEIEPTLPSFSLQEIITKEQVNYVVGGVIAIMVTRKLLNTACELILIKASR